ncbi:NAD-dependent epimerase/dehydratase family protein [Natronococcus wangiae]|uniref:NAD-dependent epimerase/dehydratase family protein n=1 Tax=Natronococcus wangiae TaxID=3068275 RepID=UPI00273E10E6|nr:NAD-dependent epimerase/dehydratase family protein [Natronococcus sp. AD5]
MLRSTVTEASTVHRFVRRHHDRAVHEQHRPARRLHRNYKCVSARRSRSWLGIPLQNGLPSRADARVVLASSAAIDGHPDQVPITEGDRKTPTSLYGLDKLAIDHYARQYHDLYGFETVGLRYINA